MRLGLEVGEVLAKPCDNLRCAFKAIFFVEKSKSNISESRGIDGFNKLPYVGF